MKLICLLVAPFVFISCMPNVQLYETKTTSPMKVEKNAYTYENDSVKIVYTFWGEAGKLSYTIFNKLSVPLYVDWKKSSYVRNSQKLDYWLDMSTTKSVSKSNAAIAYGTIYGASFNNSTTVKPEQIVFIAPRSTITKDQYLLLPNTKTTFAKNQLTETQSRTDNKKKTIKIKYRTYTEESSILIFRNFITISTSDKFEKEAYIDNGFYICKVSEMDAKNFWGDGYGKTEYWNIRNNIHSPFESPQNFYITK